MAKVGFCGSGAWGITLANLISKNGHDVLIWSIEHDVIEALAKGHRHPRFPEFAVDPSIRYTKKMTDFKDVDVIVECVTAKGFRPVCKEIKLAGLGSKPFILTSKGIEQESGKLLVEVAEDVFGQIEHLGYMSGPTLANEVMMKLPTAAVGASSSNEIALLIRELFECEYFQIYVSNDIRGVSLGGAFKNVIAIASGIADGLGYGHNTKALIIKSGLEEMKRIAKIKGAREETCDGLSGIGDLIVTGMSNLSRNFSFGSLLGKGLSCKEAKDQIKMVVEGEYTVASVYKLGKKYDLEIPIAYGVYEVIYEGKDPREMLQQIFSPEALNSAL